MFIWWLFVHEKLLKTAWWKFWKIQFHEFQPIENFLRSIECSFSINQTRVENRLSQPRVCAKFIKISTDREFLSIDRIYLFDRSNRNWESIESSRNFVVNFFNILIDCEFLSIYWTGIDNWLSHLETSGWISLIFRMIENSLQLIKCSFRSIKQESRIDRAIQKLLGEFHQFFEQLRIPFDWSIVNRESIKSSRDFKMYLLIFR